MIGTPILLLVGAFFVGVGSWLGILLSLLACIGVMHAEFGRADGMSESAVKEWTKILAIAVNVFIIIYIFNIWKISPLDYSHAAVLALVPPFAYAVYLTIRFYIKRRL